jgi:amylosucrase
MPTPEHLRRESRRTYTRLLPRLEAEFAAVRDTDSWAVFRRRLDTHFHNLFAELFALYGERYDFLYHLERLLAEAAHSWLDRPQPLQALDDARERHPLWYQSEQMLGGVCYVDLLAGDLQGLRARIPYFQELGLTYLHLMPLFAAPADQNDGGYAVSDYRTVDPRLGQMEELRALADELRAHGISLVLDFVFNHTSDEHCWARAAQAGDEAYSDYYFLFPDRTQPDAYDRTLREIFPDQHPGSFSYRPDLQRWVWTTFNSFQWDLNYRNPEVFRAMASEMLFLANLGTEVLRLDALAFTWKELGTPCESLPKAHTLVRAFNAVLRIAAPSLLFKSEAIVHPDEVTRYIDAQECQLSYNPLLMALLWNSLATREVRLLRQSLSHRFALPTECAWVNYIRCHDDIGWTFDDGDSQAIGVNGYDHRRFLNSFYTGRFPGSFARGLPFQENPRTGDARISGSQASLAGLEAALHSGDPASIELAVRRILLLHAVILSIGGIPLIYLGDEIGLLNDYRYVEEPTKSQDSRWVHRPRIDWAQMERRNDPTTLEGRIYQGLRHLIQRRKETPALAGHAMRILQVGNDHLFAYVRTGPQGERLLVLANFSEQTQPIAPNEVRLYGLGYHFHDLISGRTSQLGNDPIVLTPYQVLWLTS